MSQDNLELEMEPKNKLITERKAAMWDTIGLYDDRADMAERIVDLKAELAAKDKEIARLQKVIRVVRSALAVGQVVGSSKDALEKKLAALEQAQGEKAK